MTQMEKFVNGLECCISGNPAICKRVGCPYAEEHDGIGDTCIDHLMADALALLKAQEPRVLALDEIHRGMAVWLEDVDKADVILAIGGSSAGGAKCFITENDTSIAPLSAEYGVRWRAWTAEPTEEQREATPWS